MRCVVITFIGVLLALRASLAHGADSLSSVRDEVRTEESDNEPPPQKSDEPKKKKDSDGYTFDLSDSDGHCDKPEKDPDPLGVGACLVLAVTSPYWVPQSFLETWEDELHFASRPYHDSPGAMIFKNRRRDLYYWSTRVRAEHLDDFDSLSGERLHFLTEHVNRWGLDSEVNYWSEQLSNGTHDHLWTGDANLVHRFAQNEYIQMRSGIGVAWLSDRVDTDFGFNFTYGGDFYPYKPLVLSAEMDAGWLGEAWFFHGRTTVGLQWKQAEIYTGYDYLEIGNAQLDGWVAGVRVLF